MIHSAPGDPAEVLSGGEATPEELGLVRAKWGLDKPIYEQILVYVGRILKGDMDYSYMKRRPIIAIFRPSFAPFNPWTMSPDTFVFLSKA